MRNANIEERVRRRAKRNQIKRAILAMAYLSTLAGTAIMMPNAVQLLRHLEGTIGPRPNLKRRITQTYSELIASGLLRRQLTPKGSKVVLTKMGEGIAQEEALREQFKRARPKKWDQKWRVIMFDVWERRRGVRDRLRRSLQEFGFVRIQNSVWAYPYPCEEILVFLRASLRLGHGVLYIVAEEIEHDERLRVHFKLP